MASGGWHDGGTVGVVVHPGRDLDASLGSLRRWTAEHGGQLGQVAVVGQDRRVADVVEPSSCDVLVAIGGDGTVLAALHAAEPTGLPVLGIACGSLGALTSVRGDGIPAAMDRFAAGDWTAHRLPLLDISRDGEDLGFAFNDLVVVRGGAGQVILEVEVDGETFARMAGDGVVVATPLGSSAYTIASGGPLLAASADVFALTPLAPHGGSVPPVVLSTGVRLAIRVDGGWTGARVERDGRIVIAPEGGRVDEPYTLELVGRSQSASLVDLDGETLIAGLRRRGVIADSPRLRVHNQHD